MTTSKPNHQGEPEASELQRIADILGSPDEHALNQQASTINFEIFKLRETLEKLIKVLERK